MNSLEKVTMDRICPKHKYQCVDGKCVQQSLQCDSNRSRCKSRIHSYYCGKDNGDNCVFPDSKCMRPCGFYNGLSSYDLKCPDFPGKCVTNNLDYCPKKPNVKKCDVDEVQCSDGRCVKNYNWCDRCSGRRCLDTGSCYLMYQRCNRVADCMDRTDEANCPHLNNRQDSGYNSVEMLVGSLGAAILITLMILRGWWKLNKSRRRHQEEAAILASNRRIRYEPGGQVLNGVDPLYELPPMPGPVPPNATDHRFSTGAPIQSQFQPPQYGMTIPPLGLDGLSPPSEPPPPAYSEVVSNQETYKRTDPELPTYAESTAAVPPTHPP